MSDITIESGSQRTRAHKIILSAGCDYFTVLLSDGFKEATDSIIHLHEDRARATERLIQHFYGYKWEIPNLRHASWTPMVAEIYVDAYVVGQRYLVPTFRNTAERHLLTVLYVYITHLEAGVDLREVLVQHFIKQVPKVGDSDQWKALLKAMPEFVHDVMDELMLQRLNLAAKQAFTRVKSEITRENRTPYAGNPAPRRL